MAPRFRAIDLIAVTFVQDPSLHDIDHCQPIRQNDFMARVSLCAAQDDFDWFKEIQKQGRAWFHLQH